MLRFASVIVCVGLFVSSAAAQQSGMSKFWPFGKSSKSAPTKKSPGLPGFGMFSKKSSPPAAKKKSLPPSSNMLSRLESGTNAMWDGTRDAMKNISQMGKKLIPSMPARESSAKPKSGGFLPLFAKRESKTPATMDDFMKMERPKF